MTTSNMEEVGGDDSRGLISHAADRISFPRTFPSRELILADVTNDMGRLEHGRMRNKEGMIFNSELHQVQLVEEQLQEVTVQQVKRIKKRTRTVKTGHQHLRKGDLIKHRMQSKGTLVGQRRKMHQSENEDGVSRPYQKDKQMKLGGGENEVPNLVVQAKEDNVTTEIRWR
ncbi:hypothetical protein LIER_34631 [Lithospermum erythrorhizon]|uniref:Uncharacterized protein n=1 Tax=Lithospermum erythrorhizon TaxID=34254 RepID=A0AAV3S1U8_LITER